MASKISRRFEVFDMGLGWWFLFSTDKLGSGCIYRLVEHL